MNFATSFRKISRFSTRKAEPPDRERGWALIAVLWTLAILSMMAAATQALTVSSAHVEHRAFEQARIDAAVHAAIVRAILGLDDPRIGRRWRVDGAPQTFAFDGLPMLISVQDTAGLIDLNTADVSVIASLFVSAGVAPNTAQTLAANIDDWRTPIGGDDSTRTQGTTDGQYKAASLGYLPRHGPFQTIDELKLVIGVTPALFARVAQDLTIYSHDSDVDQSVAPVSVLAAINSGDMQKVSQALAARANPQPGDSGQPPQPPGVIPATGSSWGHAYLISIVAKAGRLRVVRSAIVEPTGDDGNPFLEMSAR